MKKRWIITFLTATLIAGTIAGKLVQAGDKKGKTATSSSSEAAADVQGFEVFSYDSDDKKFMAMCNTILREYPNLYGDEKFDAAIPVPHVVYEQKLGKHKTGQWGTFASFNFNYNPDTLLMEMVSGGYDRGVIVLEEKDGEYSGQWTTTFTDNDQTALEKEYGVTKELEKRTYSSEDVDKDMEEILKGYCEFNGYRVVGYTTIDGTVHKFEE